MQLHMNSLMIPHQRSVHTAIVDTAGIGTTATAAAMISATVTAATTEVVLLLLLLLPLPLCNYLLFLAA
jgi:hypothetical protein